MTIRRLHSIITVMDDEERSAVIMITDNVSVNGEMWRFMGYDPIADVYVFGDIDTVRFDCTAGGFWNLSVDVPSYIYGHKV